MKKAHIDSHDCLAEVGVRLAVLLFVRLSVDFRKSRVVGRMLRCLDILSQFGHGFTLLPLLVLLNDRSAFARGEVVHATDEGSANRSGYVAAITACSAPHRSPPRFAWPGLETMHWQNSL